jgi:hypothetical protein
VLIDIESHFTNFRVYPNKAFLRFILRHVSTTLQDLYFRCLTCTSKLLFVACRYFGDDYMGPFFSFQIACKCSLNMKELSCTGFSNASFQRGAILSAAFSQKTTSRLLSVQSCEQENTITNTGPLSTILNQLLALDSEFLFDV